MKPTPDTQYQIHELFTKRWSPRAFDPSPIEENTFLRIMEAARWAPSSYNEQPWRFVYAQRQNKDLFDKLLGILNEFNRSWAKNASAILIAFGRDNFSQNEKPNPHTKHDVGIAMAQLTLQATVEGLYVHQMAGFDAEKAITDLGTPEGFKAVTAAVIGKIGDPANLPEQLREKELAKPERKPLQDILFEGSWKK